MVELIYLNFYKITKTQERNDLFVNTVDINFFVNLFLKLSVFNLL